MKRCVTDDQLTSSPQEVMQTSDKTLGIKNDAEHSCLIIWVLIVLLSSFVGDSIILMATCKYRVLNLHKVMVTIIQHMAFCDLLLSIFRVFPLLIAAIANRWILGEALCHIQDNSILLAGFATLLTCALTTVKFLHLRYPLIARTWSKRTGHNLCVGLWISVLVTYAPNLVGKILYMRKTVYFSFESYECSYLHQSTSAPSWYKVYHPVSISVFHFLSYTILVVTSILILVLAKKVRSRNGGRNIRLQGTITVLLTVAIQFISYLPLTVVFVSWMTLGVQHSGEMWRAVTYAVYLNIITFTV